MFQSPAINAKIIKKYSHSKEEGEVVKGVEENVVILPVAEAETNTESPKINQKNSSYFYKKETYLTIDSTIIQDT